MAISVDALARVDEFLANESKVLDGYQPHWPPHTGYGDYQIAWNILEEDTGRIRAHLRFRLPAFDFRYPSIGVIFGDRMVSRIDLVAADVCKPNPTYARYVGQPAFVFGTHAHVWEDNRGYIEKYSQWDIPIRRPVSAAPTLDAIFFWLCSHICVRIQPHNRPLAMPEPTLFGMRT